MSIYRFRRIHLVLAFALVAVASWGVAIQADPPGDDAAARPGSQPAGAASTKRAALEKKFIKTLTGAVLRGNWQMTGAEGLKGKALLSPPQTERYSIRKVEKIGDDQWLIAARVQFAEKDVTIPVPVRVVWAEDTPMITLDKFPVPLLGTYSCRVVIYGHFYSGTWLGTSYGGVLSGQILREADAKGLEEARAAAATQPSDPKP